MAIAVGAMILAGCASIQTARTDNMERLLAAAGFQARGADTPEQVAYLETLPRRTVVARAHAGATQYLYADATGCRCVYVGAEPEYQQLRRLQQDQATEAQELRDARTRRAFDGLWRGTWPPPLQ